jgi:predicted RNA binding protein YcfA (HicA-like mRNA interferase family)
MVDQASNRIAPHAGAARISRCGLAFHDSEEIGPGMLARIAKNTGLRPEDL